MEKIAYDRGYADRLVTQKKDNEVLHKKTLEYRQGMHEKQRIFEADLKETTLKRNPFKAKINEMSLTNAKKRNGAVDTMEYNIDPHQDDVYDFESHQGLVLEDDGKQAEDQIESKM